MSRPLTCDEGVERLDESRPTQPSFFERRDAEVILLLACHTAHRGISYLRACQKGVPRGSGAPCGVCDRPPKVRFADAAVFVIQEQIYLASQAVSISESHASSALSAIGLHLNVNSSSVWNLNLQVNGRPRPDRTACAKLRAGQNRQPERHFKLPLGVYASRFFQSTPLLLPHLTLSPKPYAYLNASSIICVRLFEWMSVVLQPSNSAGPR